MKKKLAAFVLAAALVLPTSATSFAATTTPSDAVGVKEQSAIEELVALGVINGYEDGTFKPNNNITRAELAKIVVQATGGEKAAAALNSTKSQFKDVKTNVWYTGYINVATGKGYLLGDKGTGNFRPNDNIKFEEVTAIITRALGYQDSKLTGSWPYNVLLKADEIGLFDKVDIAQGTSAARGVVAQIISNALGENLVEWNADDELYQNQVDKKTDEALLLISRLGTTTNQVVTSSVLDANGRISLNGLPKSLASNFIVTGGQTLADLLGHTVTVLTDNDGKVRAVTDNQKADNIVTGKLNVAFNNGLQVELKNGTAVTKYDTVTSSTYYLNSDVAAAGDFPIAKDTEASVFLYDNTLTNRTAGVVGKVRAIVFTKVNAADALFDSYVAETSTSKARILTKSNISVTLSDTTAITINGEAKAATDLAKNDVLDIVYNKDRVAVKVTATRNVVEGKVTTVSVAADGKTTYTIDGKSYESVTGALTGSKQLTKDATYKLFLNKDGKAAGAELVSGGSADAKYGILLNVGSKAAGAFDSAKDVFRYYSIKEAKNLDVELHDDTLIGTTVRLGTDVKGSSFTGSTTTFDNTKAAIVIWHLKDTDNSVNGVKEIVALDELTTVSEKKDTTLKLSTGSVTTTYDINENTIVLDATKYNEATPGDRSVSVSNLASLSAGNSVKVITEGTSTFAKYVVITKKAAKDAQEAKYGLFVDASKSGDDYFVKLNVKGTDTTFALTRTEGKAIYDAVQASLTAGNSTYKSGTKTLVALTDSVITGAAGELDKASTAYDTLTPFTANREIATASLADGTIKFVGDATEYYVNSSTAIYVYNKATDTLTTDGIFADVTAYAGELESKYDIAIAADSNYGTFTLAKAIILVKN